MTWSRTKMVGWVLEKNLEPSSDELHERHGTRPLTDDEFDRAFGDLPREPGE